MFIVRDLSIVVRRDNTIIATIGGVKEEINPVLDPTRHAEASSLYNQCSGMSENDRYHITKKCYDNGGLEHLLNGFALDFSDPTMLLERSISEMLDFFKEFDFVPNYRFLNTLSHYLQESEKEAKQYIANYFALTDSSYQNEIREKVKSQEFANIIADFKQVAPNHIVNSRFSIYFGSQGTGKTTIAMEEADMRCVVCNSSTVPADLMEDFTFVDGKATFKPSALWECMENGKSIVLDEINLLPYESLRFLQGLLDNKKEFSYKGKTVHINDGFKIIGTMNLSVNGMTYGLPEPLVDRCEKIKNFELTAKQLMGAII